MVQRKFNGLKLKPGINVPVITSVIQMIVLTFKFTIYCFTYPSFPFFLEQRKIQKQSFESIFTKRRGGDMIHHRPEDCHKFKATLCHRAKTCFNKTKITQKQILAKHHTLSFCASLFSLPTPSVFTHTT